MEEKEYLVKMTKDEMLQFYENKIVTEGIMDCSEFSNIVDLTDYGDTINLSKYKDEILELLYLDERIADAMIDEDNNVNMIFYTDYCPYYYEEDNINKKLKNEILKDFSGYYIINYLLNDPYVTTRNLIKNYLNTKQMEDEEKSEILNMIKGSIIKSGFTDKYIKDNEVYVTPKNYKQLEELIVKRINTNEDEESEEI